MPEKEYEERNYSELEEEIDNLKLEDPHIPLGIESRYRKLESDRYETLVNPEKSTRKVKYGHRIEDF